ncbi:MULTISPECIES: type I-F CRISPR-associated protein Csy1 [Marinobacter]|nr:type I-F CRISPR-associated protein Csy1 [Marinobacter excellens]
MGKEEERCLANTLLEDTQGRALPAPMLWVVRPVSKIKCTRHSTNLGVENSEPTNMSKSSKSEVSQSLRMLMERFVQARLEGKLEKLSEDDPKRQELNEQFRFENWVADAARRVAQIQLVTHSLKATHPDAKGSSLYRPPGELNAGGLVGTSSLGESFNADVVGNAAALDVYKFLRLTFAGKSLLDRVLERDESLIAALSNDRTQAEEWVEAFAGITSPGSSESSHTKAKQVYFLVGDDPGADDGYHLLSPIYATSLAHEVFQRINRDRFGERQKEARQARREKKPFDHGFYEYPELAVQKLGGTKPQNISQLNSERGGNNYLLASLPPQWQSRDVKPPLNKDSVFPLFGYRAETKRLLRQLVEFLAADPAKNLQTRNTRDELIDDLCGELLQFAAELRTLPSGWSASVECRLPEAEQLWLDPGRAELDELFRQQWMKGDWPGTIRHRFANWLNHALAGTLPVGDPEHKHWSDQLKRDGDWMKGLSDDKRWMAAFDELEMELEA